MTAVPLAGRRIVVTRAARQSGGLQERLERQGAEVVLLPTIEIAPPESYEPLDDALRDAKRFAWLVVTSANAVRVIGERLAKLGLPAESIRHLRCAAVGPSAAEALRLLGLAVEVMPERYVGEALAAALADRVRGQRVLLVRAAVARDVVPDALAVAGADVTVVDAYRTVVPADAVERARAVFDANPLPDAVVFTSGSTVTHLLDVLRDAELMFPPQMACVSIGPVTSAALGDAGLAVGAEAETASLDALVDACARLLGR
ncbi:MAG TPA: uroporphyrinogen-III synthase [Acidobacteriaceae bacterium]|jgi:uroporphyrinogen-III synthase